MTYLITAHSTQPGKEDIYEEFLRSRKLWFVRNLKGIKSYKVYRTERRFDPSGTAPTEIRYNIMAVIECEGDLDAATSIYTSEEWIAFMGEYMHLLESDPVLYIAHEIPETGSMSREECESKVLS
ncbi:hypothetical protein MNBD_UNCLBAC01-1777 [hydrothermal vent metagenome]|uniref:Uncharacterized protein n=1 Tax=hydrothermal vent metagenome TaxID=652676 RepID=A0A3B1DDT9_9ZZZZ